MNVNNMNGILQPNLTIFRKICFAFMFRRLCGGILFFSLTLRNAKKEISNCLFCRQSGKGVLQTRVGLFTAQMDFSVDIIRVNICLSFSTVKCWKGSVKNPSNLFNLSARKIMHCGNLSFPKSELGLWSRSHWRTLMELNTIIVVIC